MRTSTKKVVLAAALAGLLLPLGACSAQSGADDGTSLIKIGVI